jgi:hypothetical protein
MTESRDDVITPAPGDHDAPYIFGDDQAIVARLTLRQLGDLANIKLKLMQCQPDGQAWPQLEDIPGAK